MDDASRLPQLNCKMRSSPAIPAPTQNQGKQRQKVSSGRAKVTGGGKTTQQNPNGHPGIALPGDSYPAKGHGPAKGAPQRQQPPLVSLGAHQPQDPPPKP